MENPETLDRMRELALRLGASGVSPWRVSALMQQSKRTLFDWIYDLEDIEVEEDAEVSGEHTETEG